MRGNTDFTPPPDADDGAAGGSGGAGAEPTLADLARLPRWLCWATEMRGGKPTKVPKNPHAPGANASATNPSTWATREKAERAWNGLRNRVTSPGGEGVVLGDLGDGTTLVGVDLDTCRDPLNEGFTSWAVEALDRLDTYAEVSPSGEGVKLFALLSTADAQALRDEMGSAGKKWAEPGGGEHGPAIEFYTAGRYFTVTGHHLPDTPVGLRRIPLDTMRWLVREAGPRLAGTAKGEKRQERGNGHDHDGADADDLIVRLHAAMERDAQLAQRWGGDASGLRDNSRSALAFALGAALKRAGFSFGEMCRLLRANEHTREWVAEKGDASGRRELRRVWERAGDAATGERGDAEDARPVDEFVILRPSEWIEPPPPQEWIVKDWIPRGVVTGLYGDGGIGKTLLAQQLLTSVGSGVPWLGLETIRGRGFGMFCEDGRDELARRQCAINAALRLAPEAVRDAVEYVSRIGADNLLMTFDGKDVGKLTATFEALFAILQRFRPDVVVLDTAADLFGGNENARPQVRQFIQAACGRIALEFNCGVVLCAHPSVAGMAAGSGTGGSTAWNNTLRSRMYLTKPKRQDKDDPEPDPDARILSRKKANYARAGEEIALIWKNGVLRPLDGHAEAGAPEGLSWETIEQIFDEIEAAWAAGNPFSCSPNTKNAARYLPDHMRRRHRVPIKRAEYYVREWIANGCLSIVTCDTHTKLKGLRVIRRPNCG